jgi:hypothetical protein
MSERVWEELSWEEKVERLCQTMTALAKTHNEFLDFFEKRRAESERAMEKLEARVATLENAEPGSEGY